MIRTEAKVSPSEPENYKEVADIAERDEVVKQDDNATSGDVTAAESSEASAKDKNLSGEDFEPGECESPPPSSEIPDFVAGICIVSVLTLHVVS